MTLRDKWFLFRLARLLVSAIQGDSWEAIEEHEYNIRKMLEVEDNDA